MRERAVFINCPFDDAYRPLFRAMIFTLILCGYQPRCMLEVVDSGALRLLQIADMIRECGHTIHDLSRTEVDADHGLPRFNMPLELGLDIGMRIAGNTVDANRLLILVDSPHDYDKYLSDASGQDPISHGDTDLGIIAAVRAYLNADPARPHGSMIGAAAIAGDYVRFLELVPDIISAGRLDPWERLDYRDTLYVMHRGIAALASTPALDL